MAKRNGQPQVAAEFRPDPEDRLDGEGLTVRQRSFIEHLLGDAGGNATKAAALAGYASENRQSLHQTASRLLSFVKVREAIARRLAKANLTPEWVRQTTAALAASNLGSFLTLGDDGEPKFDWEQAQRLGAFVQIRKYREKGLKSTDSEGDTKVDVIERTIETHNPAPYLQLLARMLGMVKDIEVGGTVRVEHDVRPIFDRLRTDPEALAAARKLADRTRDTHAARN